MTDQTIVRPPRTAGRYHLDLDAGRRTPAERVARGTAARAEVPRESHAEFDPGSDRTDPRDHQALVDAVSSGRITAQAGV